jgi:hypothetical protein
MECLGSAAIMDEIICYMSYSSWKVTCEELDGIGSNQEGSYKMFMSTRHRVVAYVSYCAFLNTFDQPRLNHVTT